MSSTLPQQYSYMDSGRFHYGYDREEYPSYNQTNNGVMSSYVQPHSRTVSRPRVGMACEHCRKRKVRCDGKKPSCSLCSRLSHVTCVYAKVTPEQNAVLREKKRLSKERKDAEQEAARASFYSHDSLPAFHPYRNAAVSSQCGSYRSSSFGPGVVEDTQRANPVVLGMPNAPALPQTSGMPQSYQPHQSLAGAYLYDGRYQAVPSTSTAANALFDVGAGLSTSRRPSCMEQYARKQSVETTASTAWSRASLPRSSFSSSVANYRYDPPGETSTLLASGMVNPSTSSYTPQATFRTEEPQRCMSGLAAQASVATPPYVPTTSPSHDIFRPRSPLDRTHQYPILSPNSTIASPFTLPALERAPSSTDSRSAASPDEQAWHIEPKKPFTHPSWAASAAAAAQEVSNWATQINPTKSPWDPVSIYLHPSQTPTAT